MTLVESRNTTQVSRPIVPSAWTSFGVSLAHCESKCENFYDAAEVEHVFYPEMEKLLLEFFPKADQTECWGYRGLLRSPNTGSRA